MPVRHAVLMKPRVPTALADALAVVARDLRATHPDFTVVFDRDQHGSWWVALANNGTFQLHGSDFSADDEPGPDLLAAVADAAQEVILELHFVVWPTCPDHNLGLHAAVNHGRAVWTCSAGGTHVRAAIGDGVA